MPVVPEEPTLPASPSPIIPLICVNCGRVDKYAAKASRHQRSCGQTYYCTTCPRSFTKRDALGKHQPRCIAQLTGARQFAHKCELCGLTFPSASGLRLHMKYCK
jgi:hypothetical protein